MHIILISACEKRALKKTRTILDSYAIRSGHSTWQAPMTKEGLKEIRSALKKVATRQTAVAAYYNYGMRRMQLAWVVGARHKFSDTGAYPVGSTRKQQRQLMIAPWVRVSSLLAGAAGDLHDIGKASQHFQHKLSPEMAGQRIKDEIRHEWLSLKLLQQLRHNGWHWQQAWQALQQHPHRLSQLTLGQRSIADDGIGLQNELEAVDYLVVTHHGLLGADDPNNVLSLPNGSNHVRSIPRADAAQLTCADELPASIFSSHQHRMQRLAKLLPDQRSTGQASSTGLASSTDQASLYWKAQALHSRAALIHADHIISAQHYSPPSVVQKNNAQKNSQDTTPKPIKLFANTKFKQVEAKVWKSVQDQPLEWHLQQVGDRAAYIAVKMMTDMNLSGLAPQTVEYICQPTINSRFQWQNIAANALQKHKQKSPDAPVLVLNIAGTGTGKTRMNLRAACTLQPSDPRISIALNLRSLTLQTGEALKSAMNLSQDELAVIIGDEVTQTLFNAVNFDPVDEDENLIEPIFDAIGEDYSLPEWLNPLFSKTQLSKTQGTKQGSASTDIEGKTILASPILVSTIDYLIAAGEPHRQGHHVKALLRILSSDLILDEIDGYEPKALIAVLRLVQLAAMYGRNVICSSATLSLTVASKIHRAFESGIQMRAALHAPHQHNQTQQNQNQESQSQLNQNKPSQKNDLSQKSASQPNPSAKARPQACIVAIIDHALKPKIWVDLSDQPSKFNAYYQQHLHDLQQHLAQQKPYRLAGLIELPQQSVIAWKQAVLQAAQQLHADHAWQFGKTEKRVSMGLIRVANIKHAVRLAQFLAEHWPHAKIACYHANDWLISRFHKEQRLDFLLSRHKDGKKRKTGNEHIAQDAEMLAFIGSSTQSDLPCIVVATPVEEVGRDHDFDWAVIDVSSVQSIVQTAGRVNRHRLDKISQPNIMIPQYNYRYCEQRDRERHARKNKQVSAVFKYPGYEGYSSRSKTNVYRPQDIEQLLPWQHKQFASDGYLSIDARLRFDQQHCVLARLDDQQIQRFCEKYFDGTDSEGADSEKDQVFSQPYSQACLMTAQIYDQTPLRENQYQDIYTFKYVQTINHHHDLMIYKQSYGVVIDKTTDIRFPKYGLIEKQVSFEYLAAQPQAWLALTPQQMIEQCTEYAITPFEGCRVSLTRYGQDTQRQWSYDWGFGIFEDRG